MAAKSSKKTPNLTCDLKTDQEGGQLLPPEKDKTPALASHLADRANLTTEQATQFLNALTATVLEQLGEHPDRYLVLPGLGAAVFHYTPASTKTNPFTNQSAQVPARGKVKFHFFPGVLDEVMPKKE